MKDEMHLLRKNFQWNIPYICAEYLKPILNIVEQISSDFDDEKVNTRCTKLFGIVPWIDDSHMYNCSKYLGQYLKVQSTKISPTSLHNLTRLELHGNIIILCSLLKQT